MKMKTKLLLSLLIVVAFFGGSLVARSRASSQDDFTANVLTHGVTFVHHDDYAEINQNDPPLPSSRFEPSIISLTGPGAGLQINGLSAITVPPSNRLIEIPEANGTNSTEVLNDIRAVLIDRGLAIAPE